MMNLPIWTSAITAAALLCHTYSSTDKLTAYALSTSQATASSTAIHSIDSISCRETKISISTLLRPITVLEATLEGQNELVDQVLMLEDERNTRDTVTIINNSIVEKDPYGSVLWPAARTVSEHITRDTFFTTNRRQQSTKKPTLLELGTGTGLVALAASASNKYESILATDYESVALKLLDAAYSLTSNDWIETTTATPINYARYLFNKTYAI